MIMLYGNSSLGKTELVREIADKFYDNNYYENICLCLKTIHIQTIFLEKDLTEGL